MFRAVYDKQYGKAQPSKLFSLAKGDLSFIQRLKLYKNLEVHSGCVNTICWSDSGSRILSGADDQNLVITCPYSSQKQLSIRSGHRANIFSAKFLPNSSDKQIVSCSGDGKIYFTEVEREDTYGTQCFNCHYGTAYEVITIPGEASTFLSCGEDGTVRWFDLRIKTKCQKEDCKEDVMINSRRAVTSLSVNPVVPYQLSVACSDGAVRIFDRRMLGTRLLGNYTGRGITGLMCRFNANPADSRPYRITSLQYSPDGEDVLVSYSSEHLYLFSTKDESKYQVYEKTAEERTSKPCRDTVSHDKQEVKQDNTQPQTSSLTEPCDTDSGETDKRTEESPESPATHTGPEQGRDAAEGTTEGATESNSRQPPIKRLRLRGDWSDTGPNARPDSERHDAEEQSPHITLMQRMSDMLTRWLDSNIRPEQGESAEGGREQGDTESRATGSPSNRESASEGAAGGTDSQRDSSPTNPEGGAQENPGLIQDLESMEIPNQPHCDITDTLRSLSKYHQSGCKTDRVQQRNTADSFQLSTSPCAIDSLPDMESSMPDVQISQNALDSHDNSSSQSEQTAALRRPSPDFGDGVKSKDSSGLSGWTEESDKTSDSSHSQTVNTKCSGKGDDWLEPVIDLQFSTQGTTSSTIHVGFAPFSAENSVSNLTHHSQEEMIHVEDNSARGLTEGVNDSVGVADRCEPPETESDEHLMHSVEIIKSDSNLNRPEVPHVTQSDSTELGTGVTKSSMEVEMSSSTSNETSSQVTTSITVTEPEEGGAAVTPGASGTTEDGGSRVSLADQSSTSSPRAERSSTRQRRIGRSGPPTGGYQLTPGEGESSDEGQTEAPRRRAHWDDSDDLERNVAAIRLQSFYRKKHAEKEEREMETSQVFQPKIKRKYRGHRNARTMIKEANFWGDNYVMSGSDCGHIFIWDRHSTKVVMLLEADRHVVNCLQPHPFDPILASSGIDYDIKVWAPLSSTPYFDEKSATEIMRRNELMLEETRDTITVPAAFMLRVLASLNHFGTGRPSENESASDSD